MQQDLQKWAEEIMQLLNPLSFLTYIFGILLLIAIYFIAVPLPDYSFSWLAIITFAVIALCPVIQEDE